MRHPFDELAPEYFALYTTMSVKPAWVNTVDRTAKRLLASKQRYAGVQIVTAVPAAVIMCIAEREMGGNVERNLAQGDPLTDYSVHVPKGEPRFTGHEPPFTWEEAAVRALQIDGLNVVRNWTVLQAAYQFEIFNGEGYRNNHHIRSPYLWGLTNQQQPGKYVEDGKYVADHLDTQIGTMPLLRRIMELDASLAIPVGTPPLAKASTQHDAYWVQRALNALGFPEEPLLVDGNTGRMTRRAVVAFQKYAELDPDGLVGPLTQKALEDAVAKAGKEVASGPSPAAPPPVVASATAQ